MDCAKQVSGCDMGMEGYVMHGVVIDSDLERLVAGAGMVQQLVEALHKPTAQIGWFGMCTGQ